MSHTGHTLGGQGLAQGQRPPRRARLQRLGLGLLLPLALAGLLWSAGAASVWQRAAALPAATWLVALGGLLASYALRAARLHAEWHGHAPLPPGTALRITLQHLAALNLLPLRAGELGYPWLLHRHCGMALADAVGSLLWMRLQDALTLSSLGGLLVLAVLQAKDQLDWAAALALPLAWLLLLALALRRLRRWAATPWRQAATQAAPPADTAPSRAPAVHRIGPAVQAVHRALRQALQRARPGTWLWCGANWVVKLATVAWLLAALAGLPAHQGLSGALGGELGGALPVQPPAGFGTYEAGSALAATLAGPGTWVDLLGAALVVHLFAICTAVLAGSLATLLPAAAPPTRPAAPLQRGQP